MTGLAFLLLAVSTDLLESGQSEYYGPITADIQLNAMIGNGNAEMSWAWVRGRRGEEVTLTIEQLVCQSKMRKAKCIFEVHRSSSSKEPKQVLPELLYCKAKLEVENDGGDYYWKVVHYPPNRSSGGHSRTAMKCRESNRYRL